jgi:hypothetical protein
VISNVPWRCAISSRVSASCDPEGVDPVDQSSGGGGFEQHASVAQSVKATSGQVNASTVMASVTARFGRRGAQNCGAPAY